MKVIVAGGRFFKASQKEALWLQEILNNIGCTEIVSGACKGADMLGEYIGKAILRVPVKRFPADWKNNGLAAGPMRNKEMAEYADICILFPGGKGTASMKKEAENAGVKVYEYCHRCGGQIND